MNCDIDQKDEDAGHTLIPDSNFLGFKQESSSCKDASNSDALEMRNSDQSKKAEPAMSAAVSVTSAKLSLGNGISATKPASGTRRQLPVPQVLASAALLSHINPPKSLLPQKISDKNSRDGCPVEVAVERKVKVEMIKQVKVNCAVQESCESRSLVAVPSKNGFKATGVTSTRSSLNSPLETATRGLNHPSKVGILLLKGSPVPSGQSVAAQPKKTEMERTGAISAPPVGVPCTIRRGVPRQLPNTDLVKQVKQKETLEKNVVKGPCKSPMVAKPQQSQPVQKPSICKNKLAEKEKSVSKISTKPSNLATKPASECNTVTSSKIVKPNFSVDSSASSSASSMISSRAALKRPLHLRPPPLNLVEKQVQETLVSNNSKKAGTELRTSQTESRLGSRAESQASESSIRSVEEGQKRSGLLHFRRPESLRRTQPAKKQNLFSVTGKDLSSSRKTSSSSISSGAGNFGRCEKNSQGGSSFQDGRQSSDREICNMTPDASEERVNMSYPHQPDVVSNSVQREMPIKKLHLLEMQCKTMGKQLSFSNKDLRTRTTAFEAMLVVIKYYVEQMNFMSKMVSDLRSQLISENAKCDVLAYQRNALIAEIQGLKEDHEVQVNGMTVTHEMERHAYQERTRTLITEVEERHLKTVAALQSESKQMIEDLKSQHERELDAKNTVLSQQMSDSELKYKQKISDLQRSHENRVKELMNQFETIKSALVEKIDNFSSECVELRQRNQVLVERDPVVLDSFRNHEAEKQVETLTQEIESLKVVLELRNEEINKLRIQNVAQETQLVELAEAKQKILQLEQKLENTEAIVDMKSNYERELAEKHTTLLRRYSKESKVNKRLSMNNEELMWKLEQVAAPTTSPKAIRRTHSGPPAKSAPGTPLLVRRSQPEMNWESFSSKTGETQDQEDSD